MNISDTKIAEQTKELRKLQTIDQLTKGLWFIALNDEPGESDVGVIAEQFAVLALAEAFEIRADVLAYKIVAIRKERGIL